MVYTPNPKNETETVAGRLTEDEKERFYQKADEVGKKPSHIVRELVLGFVNGTEMQINEGVCVRDGS